MDDIVEKLGTKTVAELVMMFKESGVGRGSVIARDAAGMPTVAIQVFCGPPKETQEYLDALDSVEQRWEEEDTPG